MFAKRQGPPAGSPLLRQTDSGGPSLFSAALKSKYMSPVKLAGLPQKETTKEKGKRSVLRSASRNRISEQQLP